MTIRADKEKEDKENADFARLEQFLEEERLQKKAEIIAKKESDAKVIVQVIIYLIFTCL